MKIVIASHGELASGVVNSLEMIIGEVSHIETIAAYTDKDVDYSKVILETVKKHNFDKEKMIVLTDLLGGSVNSEFMKYIDDYPFYLVSGFNLALVLEVALLNDVDLTSLKEVVDKSSEAIIIGNIVENDLEDEEF